MKFLIQICEKIIKIFNLTDDAKKQAISLIKSIYKMFIEVQMPIWLKLIH